LSKLKDQLFATDLVLWRKKGIFIILVFLSLFPFVLMVISVEPKYSSGLWKLRHFIVLAIFQAVAQISIGLYVLNNKIPNYVIYSVVSMALLSQIGFGIAVALVSNA